MKLKSKEKRIEQYKLCHKVTTKHTIQTFNKFSKAAVMGGRRSVGAGGMAVAVGDLTHTRMSKAHMFETSAIIDVACAASHRVVHKIYHHGSVADPWCT